MRPTDAASCGRYQELAGKGWEVVVGRGLPAASDLAFQETAKTEAADCDRIVGLVRNQARGEELPLTVVMPAFMVSELTTAFKMGLFLYVPLLLVDVLVAAMLMSMGMMMVPPTMIALPLKVGVFLMADGWRLVVASLARSFA